MAKKEVILIFDIGKTNKKVVLFDQNLSVVDERETMFEETVDDDGFPCDDAEQLESWIDHSLETYIDHPQFEVRSVNFATYGATLVFLNNQGKRITPIYNYLKPMPEEVFEGFYEKYGGVNEISRKTASPALGMLNSGMQILWLKKLKPEIYQQVKTILHLPQYLSFRITDLVTSEPTSVGCHTAMWDFDDMKYHQWISDESITLPQPEEISDTLTVKSGSSAMEVGKGIHDSSASLAPYILVAEEPFILISTGTWCISMNPYNQDPLTADELSQDCLCYLSVKKKPVKSSRFFLGRIHDVNVERLETFFNVEKGSYKEISPGVDRILSAWNTGRETQLFFKNGIPDEYVDNELDPGHFESFEAAYIQLMIDLIKHVIHSIKLIIPANDRTKHLYITGGFAKNPLFTTLLSLAFHHKRVFTSEIDNATSLGAALVIADRIWEKPKDTLDLGLKEVVVH